MFACLYAYLCTIDVQCPRRPEEGVGSSGNGVTDCYGPLWCSRNPTQVLQENSQCFRLPSHYLSCFTEKWCRSSLEHSVLFALWAWGLSKTEMTMCVPVRAAVFRASSTGMWGGAECTGRGLGTGPAGWAFHLTDEPHWASSGWPLWRLRYYSLLTRLIPVLSCPQLATS